MDILVPPEMMAEIRQQNKNTIIRACEAGTGL